MGLNSVLAMEGSYPPNELTEGKTPAPATADEAIDFLYAALKLASQEKPMVSANRGYDFASDGGYVLDTEASDCFKETVRYVMSDVGDGGSALSAALADGHDNIATAFGDPIENVVRMPVLYAEDVESFDVDYIYYNCSSCGENSAEPLDRCELCGSDLPYQMKYKDEYTVTLHLKTDDAEMIEKNFEPKSAEDALAAFGDSFKGVFEVEDIASEYTVLTVTYRVRRVTDQIVYLGYTKESDVTAAAAMQGDYASLGTENVRFGVITKDHFDFIWPSLVLSKHLMAVEPKGNDNLQATLTCDDPVNQTVTWSSSDESILTVDEEGYFKAGKQSGSAVITASFEFGGKTYFDECTVNVRYSVESMKMSKKNLKLGVGESAQLKATVSPKNSTVQTVTWYTEDESIASVDENGTVRANAPGTVTVYALSDDGYFKSSCTVTVR